ncbi:MAG: methionyl-tRNA formyltransferase [Bacteroidetes bacterium HGW-Bacteroidetes-5]|jgi:methionyl-tRNA formyltransferase|nr:MAG: methionyl-tRNA formyltransferase [Bacteroidetes bacterium HGW-Bacteroidetes-5]
MRCKIVYMGTPEFAVGPIRAILDAGHEVCAVVTTPDKPVGRGLKVSQSSVKLFAQERSLQVLQPESLKEEGFINDLKSFNADLFVVVAFRMLPKVVWSIPSFGTFNLHASLLPQYRGAAPINWAVINGESLTGVTTFMIDDKIDTGEILFSRECAIEQSESAGNLHDKLMVLGSNLVVETIDAIISDRVKRTPQSSLITGEITLREAPKLTKESGIINWQQTSNQVFNLIRGLSPYPCATSVLSYSDKVIPVKIYSALDEISIDSDSDISGNLKPGEIASDNKSFLRVGCGKGSIKITSIQAAGKRRLEIREFLSGIREISLYKFN